MYQKHKKIFCQVDASSNPTKYFLGNVSRYFVNRDISRYLEFKNEVAGLLKTPTLRREGDQQV